MIKEFITIFFLTLGNYLNYIDRSITFTILPEIGNEFNMTKTEQGILASSFLGGYVVFSIIFCILAHKMKTSYLVCIGCFVWCISCIIMFFANKPLLYVARILSGVGEAAYQSLIPTFIERNFKKNWVPICLAIFFSGIYVGSSLGIIIGGVGKKIWRYLYLIEMGIMCLNIIFLIIYSRFENYKSIPIGCQKIKNILKDVLFNKLWWLITIAYSLFNFTSGAVNTWLPSFILDKFNNLNFEEIEIQLGIVILISSLIAAVLCGIPIKMLQNKYPNKSLTINSVSIILLFSIALIPIYISLNIAMSWYIFLLCVFIFIFLLTSTTLPINLLLLNIVMEDSKNYSIAMSICIMHLLGDIPSPIIVGKIWDITKNATLAIQYSTIGLVIAIILFFIIGIITCIKEKRRRISHDYISFNEEIIQV